VFLYDWRRASRLACLAAVVLTVLCSLPPASAYEVMDVPHGGSLEGTVVLDGPVPEPKGFNLITFPDPAYCGRISNGRGWRLLRDFVVSPQGGLKDAIVLLEGVEAGKPFETSVPLIEARDCQFQPFMTIVRNGHAVEVVNMDPVMHDIQGYETSLEAGARVLFNTPLVMNHEHHRGDLHATHNHAPGKSLVGPIYLNKGRRTFYMQCGFHAYMESSDPSRHLSDGGVASADGTRDDEDGHDSAGRQTGRASIAAGSEGPSVGLQGHGQSPVRP
jgi:hypothetical protein